MLLASSGEGADPGQCRFTILDSDRSDPVPCRIHLRDDSGKPVKPDGLLWPYWKDHFVCNGEAAVSLPTGIYHYEIERGPEFAAVRNEVRVESGKTIEVRESIARITDLKQEQWWSGETHIHRSLTDVELLMRAEDLHVGVVITWWNDQSQWHERPPPASAVQRFDQNRMVDVLGGEDERGGGALLMTGLKSPLSIIGSKRESPPSVKWLLAAKEAGAWVDAEKPFWWDFPVWLSTRQLDSVGLANNHMTRGGMYPGGEAWGKPRDREQFPEPIGNGDWSQFIYYQALNAGFRLPPTAGSASGVLPNPVGYNRMYAYLDQDLTWDNWWAAVRAGRVFVTNGPLLRLTADLQLPGHVFQSADPMELTIDGRLDSRDQLAAIELVRNGRVEPIAKLPAKITITESGWFLVRVRAEVKDNFRFASTGPWYVEIQGRENPMRREACDFFRGWTEERIDRLREKLTSDAERREVLPVFEDASQFWTQRLEARLN